MITFFPTNLIAKICGNIAKTVFMMENLWTFTQAVNKPPAQPYNLQQHLQPFLTGWTAAVTFIMTKGILILYFQRWEGHVQDECYTK